MSHEPPGRLVPDDATASSMGPVPDDAPVTVGALSADPAPVPDDAFSPPPVADIDAPVHHHHRHLSNRRRQYRNWSVGGVGGLAFTALVLVLKVSLLIQPSHHQASTLTVSPEVQRSIQAEVNPANADCRLLSPYSDLLAYASQLSAADPSAEISLMNGKAASLLTVLQARTPPAGAVPALQILVADTADSGSDAAVAKIVADVTELSRSDTFSGCTYLNSLYGTITTPDPKNATQGAAR